jgi:hypothetical protein
MWAFRRYHLGHPFTLLSATVFDAVSVLAIDLWRRSFLWFGWDFDLFG